MFDAHSFPVDQSVEELAERIYSDQHPGLNKHGGDIDTNMAHAAEILCCWLYNVCLTLRSIGSRINSKSAYMTNGAR